MTLIFLFILYLLMTNQKIVAEAVLEACRLWLTVLVPTMFPSLVMIDIIEQLPLVKIISRLLFPFFKLIFKINSPKSSFIILMSILCGAPASTKMIQHSYENKEITKNEYDNLICAFSNLSLPYCLMIFTKFHLSIILYFLFYYLISFIWMRLWQKKEDISYIDLSSNSINIKYFFNSIQKNTQILFNILGILIIFKVLMSLIFKNEPLFYPYFEILGGLNYINNSFVILSSIGFLGFSIHLQILSIAGDIKYAKFLFSRIIYGLLGFLVIYN